MNVFPFYCQAEENSSKNPVKLGKEEEKARIDILENPRPENIAKHKEITKKWLDAAQKFSQEYSKDKKRTIILDDLS